MMFAGYRKQESVRISAQVIVMQDVMWLEQMNFQSIDAVGFLELEDVCISDIDDDTEASTDDTTSVTALKPGGRSCRMNLL